MNLNENQLETKYGVLQITMITCVTYVQKDF